MPPQSFDIDGRSTDSCFTFIGAHQCGILMVDAGRLAPSGTSSPSSQSSDINHSPHAGYSVKSPSLPYIYSAKSAITEVGFEISMWGEFVQCVLDLSVSVMQASV